MLSLQKIVGIKYLMLPAIMSDKRYLPRKPFGSDCISWICIFSSRDRYLEPLHCQTNALCRDAMFYMLSGGVNGNSNLKIICISISYPFTNKCRYIITMSDCHVNGLTMRVFCKELEVCQRFHRHRNLYAITSFELSLTSAIMWNSTEECPVEIDYLCNTIKKINKHVAT